MKCKNLLIGSKRPGATLLLSLALLLLLSSGLSALEKLPDGSVKLTAAEYQEVATLVQSLKADLESLKSINNQQATDLTTSAKLISELQETNKNQAGLLTAQKIGLTDLKTSLESQKTISTVVTTAGIISMLANIAQAIAYQLKP